MNTYQLVNVRPADAQHVGGQLMHNKRKRLASSQHARVLKPPPTRAPSRSQADVGLALMQQLGTVVPAQASFEGLTLRDFSGKHRTSHRRSWCVRVPCMCVCE